LITLWRVSQHQELQGVGGLRAPGRWHERGSPIVYLSETPAGALLEACVHTSANDVPPKYTLLHVDVADSVSLEMLDVSTLPDDWPDRPDVTQNIGSAWLDSRRTALLRVPSALVPATFNVLLNPVHADAAGVRIQTATQFPFDLRIKR
jgi:RES domain-containing protein